MSFPLTDFGVDLTARAREGKLDPLIGRERELMRLVRVLARKTKNNPVLLGEPGVGKTAIVEGLAHRIVLGEVPRELTGVTLFSLSLGSLLAGTSFRGEFEERLQGLVTELQRPGRRRLLFVDELHLLGKAGRSEGGLDAGNLLKPLLARGELPCIGASTPAEWSELIARDPALERRFQPIVVRETTPSQTLQILLGLRGRFERHHAVQITEGALRASVEFSSGGHSERQQPDRAVDLLDEACALLRLGVSAEPTPEVTALHGELAVAEARFDLTTYARIRYHELPTLATETRPVLDADTVARAFLEAERSSEPDGSGTRS